MNKPTAIYIKIGTDYQQHMEIRANMGTLLISISEKIGIAMDPHQTWQERLLVRIDDLVEIGDGL